MGAIPREGLCPPVVWSQAEWLVAEVDESDGTISEFSPEITLALNLDWDHPGYYESEAKLDVTFRALFERTQQTVLIPDSNARLESLVGGLGAQVLRFGERGDYIGHLQAAPAQSSTLVLSGLFAPQTITVPCASAFNASNALAALAAATTAGFTLCAEPLADFAGVMRRQDCLYHSAGLIALADYAHHPEELQALIVSLRKDYPGHQLVGLFQPHRYTRTRQYAKDFARELQRLDSGYVWPVYAASEKLLAEGTSASILSQLAPGSSITAWPQDNPDRAWAQLDVCSKQSPTVLVFIGAGDIYKVAREWKARLLESLLNAPEAFSLEAIQPFLTDGTYLKQAEPLSNKTTLRVGGAARWYAEPVCREDLQVLRSYAQSRNLPVFVLGRGSNILVTDEGFDGLVIRLSHCAWRQITRLEPDRMWVGAGVRLKEICGHASLWGLSGFEFMEGIPGAVGGAVRMNAGAMGGWFMDVVESVEWLTPQGELRISSPAELDVIYRSTRGLQGGVALGVVLRAKAQQTPAEVEQRTQTLSQKRKSSQPRESSAGCMFKNPENNFAGKLVDEAGLKGLQRGNAQVSAIHGNFIVNLGQAKAQDVLDLVKEVHTRVQAQTGIALEPEVQLLGKSWKDII
ncbi:MAG: UDP-N-acetylenolpyruvoylglucosamine reductase [Verrucomicrobia bacterium 21-51-4]|nr:MAG: UDP-N-acetylenolpyruvoylglucosamine reductase [Verrucomicrobia bacterium 21-51-4]